MLRSRHARRLLIAVAVLVMVDVIEPGILRTLEAGRYEDVATDFRFENSDLFGVAPLIDYLREHPRGRQPRVMFIGNSVTYGYGLTAAEAVPGQFQRLDRSEKILNAGVNGFEGGSAYLVAKAAMHAVDQIYVLTRTHHDVNPGLLGRIPIDASDAQHLELPVDGALKRSIAAVTNRWALYRDAYRIQAALFGTSSRQFLYLHKGDVARAVVSTVRASQQEPQPDSDVEARAPIARSMPTPERLDALRRTVPPPLWMFVDAFRASNARLTLLQFPGFAEWLPDAQSVADFNRAYGPQVRIVILDIPSALLEQDGMHLRATGAALVARALWRERQANEALTP